MLCSSPSLHHASSARGVVRLCVEGGARVGDRRVAEPREQLVDARVDATSLIEVGRVDDGKVVLPDAPPLVVELLHVARREAALAHDEANQRRGAGLQTYRGGPSVVGCLGAGQRRCPPPRLLARARSGGSTRASLAYADWSRSRGPETWAATPEPPRGPRLASAAADGGDGGTPGGARSIGCAPARRHSKHPSTARPGAPQPRRQGCRPALLF